MRKIVSGCRRSLQCIILISMSRIPARCVLCFAGAVLIRTQFAQADQCELIWKIGRSGEYVAEYRVSWELSRVEPGKIGDPSEIFPLPIRDAASFKLKEPKREREVRYELKGKIRDPERQVGEKVMHWLGSSQPSGQLGNCEFKRVELRTRWRYEHVPSESFQRFPGGNVRDLATMSLRRLSAMQDRESKDDYYGVEAEISYFPEGQGESNGVHAWVEKLISETDLREPGFVWNDRPKNVPFSTRMRADLSIPFGSYSVLGRSAFGTGVVGAFASESSISETVYWKKNFFGTRLIFGDFSDARGADGIGLSFYDFHLATGLHWRPVFHANDVQIAGIRNFISFSSTFGLHRVFASSRRPSQAELALTAASVDFGIAWGGFNRKKDIGIGLEFHYLKYLTEAPLGPGYEFALSLSL